MVLSHAHSGPALQQAPAAGLPACVDTMTVLKDGRSRGHQPLRAQRPWGPCAQPHASSSQLGGGRGQGANLFGLKNQSDYLFTPKAPSCNKEKKTQKRKVVSKGTQMVIRGDGPGRNKDLLVRHTVYIFCCVFLFIL